MTHPLDNLTDEQRAEAPGWAITWVEAERDGFTISLANADLATHFAKALLTSTSDNVSQAATITRLEARQLELLADLSKARERIAEWEAKARLDYERMGGGQ